MTGELRPWGLGVFEGKITNEVLPELKKYIRDENKVPKDGESFKDFRLRVLMYLTSLLNDVIKHDLQVVASTHFRVLKVAEAWVENGCPRDLSVDEKTMMTDGQGTGEVYTFPLETITSRG